MKSINISTRLTLSFTAMVLIIAILGAVSLVQSSLQRNEIKFLINGQIPINQSLSLLTTGVTRQASMYRDLSLFNDREMKLKNIEEIKDLRKSVVEQYAFLEKSLVSNEGRDLLGKMKIAREKFISDADKYISLLETDEAGALVFLQEVLHPTQSAYEALIRDQSAFQDKRISAVGERAESAAISLQRSIWIAGVIGVLVAIGLSVPIIRSITAPLKRAVEVADQVAAGDLTARILVNSKDETGQLLGALDRMQKSLIGTVSTVRQNAESVASASAQISSGNSDLSARTENQASALEETAASMEELGSTVKQNADSANQANQMAKNASVVAIQGGEVVAEVVATMKSIDESSNKIADIISVIDSIAFQTNILALNAAVEAARAGEQGRGFAVVASEVRALAGRSAEAAKEIKVLIATSVERVGQGSVLVDKAGKTMTDVVLAIRQVTDIMGEISAASQEQSQGVAQVGEAVAQMDQATQQNAALVEEMAAAASSLNHQAQSLVEAVAVFKLAEHEQVGRSAMPNASVSTTKQVTATNLSQVRNKSISPIKYTELHHPVAISGTQQSKGKSDSEWETF